MAEEKKTKTTTKKTTTKKKVENKEEVKVEKRFCTNCGKELSEGEVCTCSQKETTNEPKESAINTDVIISTCKDILKTITNVFKKPDTTIKEEVSTQENKNTLILFILLAISFAFYLIAVLSTTVNSAIETVNKASLGLTSTATANINVPYFKIFVYGIIIYAILVVIPALSAFIVAKLTKNSDFSFKKALKLYIISSCPLIFGYAGMAILLLLNISLLNILGMIALSIISVFCFFNFVLGFNKETTIREDRRSYGLTSMVLIWVVVEVIAVILVAGSVFSDIYNAYNHTTNKTNTSDIFNW